MFRRISILFASLCIMYVLLFAVALAEDCGMVSEWTLENPLEDETLESGPASLNATGEGPGDETGPAFVAKIRRQSNCNTIETVIGNVIENTWDANFNFPAVGEYKLEIRCDNNVMESVDFEVIDIE